MDLATLANAIQQNLEYLYKIDPERIFQYGPHQYTSRQVRQSQEELLAFLSRNPTARQLNSMIRKNYVVYRATGRIGKRSVLFTGYFEPIYEGSLVPDESHKYPLYRMPEDLIEIDLSLFSQKYAGEKIVARVEDNRVLPYYTRSDIEVGKALKDKGLEIAWLKDPVEVDILQIQGSGSLRLLDGRRVRIGYAGKNGRPYRSIGRYLIDKGFIEREKLSMQAIMEYLSGHPDQIDEVLNHDPSYVFFRILGDDPIVGRINVPLTPGRSVALDYRLFPDGALCFISTQKPIISDKGQIESWRNFSRLVLNQDTGGAIRGAGRADLFWGSGPYAGIAAGHMKHEGELYVLIKKPGGR